MSPQEVVSLGRESLYVALLLSAPMLGFGLLAGVLVSIFQAVTSIQEMTFIPKILAVVAALLFFFPWMLTVWVDYAADLLSRMSQFVD